MTLSSHLPHSAQSRADQTRADPTRRGLSRRALIVSAAAASVAPFGTARAAGGYAAFLQSVRQQARSQGIGDATLRRALDLAVPNAHVLELDRHQPEFTLTWAQYRARVLPETRLARARENMSAQASLFDQVRARFGVDPGVIIGIWGLESNFGAKSGSFGVFDSLATLAYDARRAAFFRGELLNALRIADDRAIAPGEMLGSYAGAMGQPQFMPSAYLHYARAFDGGARADIWNSEPDVFASIANYLAKCGWRVGEPWVQQVQVTRPIEAQLLGRDGRRPLGNWQELGVRRLDGARFSRSDVEGALLQPDGPGTEAFLVYGNFNVIRRYNPSDFYALGVGLLGNAAG